MNAPEVTGAVSDLSARDRTLCVVYGACALVALVGTQLALLAHLTDGGSVADAFSDIVATPAATFVTVDLLVVAVAGVVFLLAEGRRLGMSRLWVYVLLTFTVAISVALPLFLLMRQRKLSRV